MAALLFTSHGTLPVHSMAAVFVLFEHRINSRCLLLPTASQVFIGIQPVFNSRLGQTVHDCSADGTLRVIGKQEVLPSNDKRLNASFGPDVGDIQSTTF